MRRDLLDIQDCRSPGAGLITTGVVGHDLAQVGCTDRVVIVSRYLVKSAVWPIETSASLFQLRRKRRKRRRKKSLRSPMTTWASVSLT
uniref:Uncharacterized protein n=1 Tax=Anguilla anguilla TaxID=7936 RepID=A0A0E9V9S1_ANGAN